MCDSIFLKSDGEKGIVSAFGLRFLDVTDGGSVDVAEFLSPKKRALNRADGFSPVGRPPRGVSVNPLLNVEGAELIGLQPFVEKRVGEALQMLVIKAVGAGRTMLLRPFQKAIDDAERERRFDGRRSLHQLVITAEGVGFISAEIVLFSVKLDVPEAAISPEKRFGIMAHERFQCEKSPENLSDFSDMSENRFIN